VREKGFLDLFAAGAQLGDRYRVVVAGPDDDAKSDALTGAEIAAARAAGVTFLGMREDIDRVYAAMDVFTLPSYREGFPQAAMEATAMGVPVVATDIRGCRQIVEHGVTGLLVPVRAPARIADAIRTIVETPGLADTMGAAAVDRAHRQFDERRVAEVVIDAYVTALSRGRRRGRSLRAR
jgi:glycosyltransferase involved in cell wall biosynthesis